MFPLNFTLELQSIAPTNPPNSRLLVRYPLNAVSQSTISITVVAGSEPDAVM